MDEKKRGLHYGYKPNRISLYLLMIDTGRIDELRNTLYDDMEKFRLTEKEMKELDG